jgi:hypothetical protein
MAHGYIKIAIVGCPYLTEVRLYDETMEHIAEQHPEFRLRLPSQRAGLVVGMTNPSRLHASTTDPQRSVVLVSGAFTYFGDALHVPIRMVQPTSGRVVTAYFSGGTYPGKLLWSVTDE